MKANFTDIDLAKAGNLANSTTLTAALQQAEDKRLLMDVYEVHLWNYCVSDGTLDHCLPKHSQYYFDPVAVWGLNGTNATSTATSTATGVNVIDSDITSATNKTEEFENKLLGKSGKEALDAYRHVAKWMFVAYEVSLWTTLATIVCSILAIFSRWGSFLTWLFSIASAIFTFGAVLTSTVLFGALVGALQTIFHPYDIKIDLGTHALIVTWLAVAFSWAATFFWLFSVCCCSGRSNPHHRSNKGGLWNAEPKGQGYGEGRGRGLRVEKTGGYERVASPFIGGEDVPMHDYARQQHGHARGASSGPFEPYRHS